MAPDLGSELWNVTVIMPPLGCMGHSQGFASVSLPFLCVHLMANSASEVLTTGSTDHVWEGTRPSGACGSWHSALRRSYSVTHSPRRHVRIGLGACPGAKAKVQTGLCEQFPASPVEEQPGRPSEVMCVPQLLEEPRGLIPRSYRAVMTVGFLPWVGVWATLLLATPWDLPAGPRQPPCTSTDLGPAPSGPLPADARLLGPGEEQSRSCPRSSIVEGT